MLKHDYADINDIRLHYVTAGKGKLLMFAHGFPEFWYEWKNQLTEFEDGYQVVAPDMRGYNLSSKPADVEQYRVEYLIEDLRLLAEHLGHKRFILIGHDWGGAVAWAFASRHPDYLEKLIIINAPHPGVFDRELRENPAQQRASQYMLMFRGSQAEQALSADNHAGLVDSILGRGLREGYFTAEDRDAYLAAWSQPGALTGGLNYYRAAQVGPPSDQGGQARGNFGADTAVLTVAVPTLVIWGEQDQALLTGNLEGLDEFVPELTVKRIPDGSHWVVHEKPDLVNAYIRDFIENKLSG
ncbi:MAG: alpha/beta hydrolase [Dehalococcoidales bacterium]|nr:alpha/beta hydrolase [Dehalococcoidales bacterium]